MWVWLPEGDGPFPLLLTAPRDYQIPWAELALERGYAVCLYPGVDSHHREPAYPAYDSIWQEFRKEYPEATWTEIITKAWLAGRTLDYLFDPKRGYPLAEGQVGIIGFSRYGKQSMIAAANEESARRTMRGFKIAHAKLREQLQKAEAKVDRLLRQRKKVSPRVPATERKALKTKKKLIADTIKMAAYQVETQLLGMLQNHYARADEEGRTLLQAAMQSPARLEVADGELRVTIAARSSPHRTAALAALCEQVDALAVPFPGTHLRLRLAVQTPEPVIS